MTTVFHYLIALWIIWILMVSYAVYRKWTTKRNFIFYVVYGYLVISFGIIGWYYQGRDWDLNYALESAPTMGVMLMLIQQFIIAVGLTIFLQISVWWFTQRMHRK